MTERRRIALALLLVSACSPDVKLPDDTRVRCGPAGECPVGYSCRPEVDLCVDDRSDDHDAPALAAAPSWVVGEGALGTVLVLDVEVDEPLAHDPSVSLGTGADAPVLRVDQQASSPGAGRYRLTRRLDGSEPEGLVAASIGLVDLSGNTTTVAGGEVLIDFTAPAVSALAWLLPTGKEALTHGDVLDFTGELDEEPAVLTARLLDALGETVLELPAPTVAAGTGGWVLSGTATLPPAGLSPGYVTLEVVAADVVGNTSQPAASRGAPTLVDLEAPSALLALSGKPLTQAATVEVQVAAADGVDVRFGGDITDAPTWRSLAAGGSFTVTLQAGVGEKTVSAVVRDLAWNESALLVDTITYDPNVDETGPRLVGAAAANSTTVILTFDEPLTPSTAVSLASYSVVDTSDDTPLTFGPLSQLGDGRQVLMTTDTHAPGAEYRVTALLVTDASTNANLIDPAYDDAVFTGFGLSDASPPFVIGPEDGGVVADPAAEVRLAWSERFGATIYTVEIERDGALWPAGAALTASEAFLEVALPAGHTYTWKVRADVTTEGEYSTPASFGLVDDVLYVSCPAPGTCDAGGKGTIDEPFARVARALDVVARNPDTLWEVRIAGRAGAASYDETLVLPTNLILRGGYDPADPLFEARDLDDHRTIIGSSSIATVQVRGARVARPVTLDGLELENDSVYEAYTLYIADSDLGLTVSETVVRGPPGVTKSVAVYLASAGDSLGTGPTFTDVRAYGGALGSLGGSTIGMLSRTSAPTLIDCVIEGGDVVQGISVGLRASDGFLTLRTTTVRGGDAGASGFSLVGLEADTTEVDIERSYVSGGVGPGNTGGGVGGGIIKGSVFVSPAYGNSGATPGLFVWNPAKVTTISHSTIISGYTSSDDPTRSALWAYQARPVVVSSILAMRGGYGNCIGLIGNLGVSSLHDNVLTGCACAYKFHGGVCSTTEEQVNDPAVLAPTATAAAAGNLTYESVANFAALGFANAGAGDFRLTGGTDADVLTSGRDALSSTCGADGSSSCGGFAEDYDGDERPGADGEWSVGAFEP